MTAKFVEAIHRTFLEHRKCDHRVHMLLSGENANESS